MLYTVRTKNETAESDWFKSLYGMPTTTKRYVKTYSYIKEEVAPSPYSETWFQDTYAKAKTLLAEDKNKYIEFSIPKRTGGYRKINAPVPELKLLQQEIAYKLTHTHHRTDPFVLAHNAAFAYIQRRGTVDALKVHQDNESRWYLKLDLQDFFPSFTKAFIMEQKQKLWPWCTIDEEVFSTLIDACLLEGALPQGSPASPMLSNICFNTFDHAIVKAVYGVPGKFFKYTRYADDLLISSRFDFDKETMETLIKNTLAGSPFKIKTEKTRYGSNSGRNWNLGLMVNKDNDITIGHKRKKSLRNSLCSFCLHPNDGVWELADLHTLRGNLSYLKMVEPAYYQELITRLNSKYSVDIDELFKGRFRDI